MSIPESHSQAHTHSHVPSPYTHAHKCTHAHTCTYQDVISRKHQNTTADFTEQIGIKMQSKNMV